MNQVIHFLLILSLTCKTSTTGNTYNVSLTIIDRGDNPVPNPNYGADKKGTDETEVFIPLKHLSNFRRSLKMPLINFEVELIWTWSKNCALAYMTANAAADPTIAAPTGLEFKITDTKL